MRKSNNWKDGRYFTYGANRYDELVVYNAKRRLFPDDQKPVYEFADQQGERTEFNRLLGLLQRGDYLGISSVVALEDSGKEETIIRKLRKLDRMGVKVVVALESDFSFSGYDTMFRRQRELQNQRKWFQTCCVPPAEDYEQIPMKGGDSYGT